MEIRIESCKGNVTVDSFGLAGEWLEEMQPSYAVATVDGVELDERVEEMSCCDVAGNFCADLVAKCLRRAYRAQQAEACA